MLKDWEHMPRVVPDPDVHAIRGTPEYTAVHPASDSDVCSVAGGSQKSPLSSTWALKEVYPAQSQLPAAAGESLRVTDTVQPLSLCDSFQLIIFLST